MAPVFEIRLALIERYELIRLPERQRIEQHAIDHREECGVGANAQRQ